LFKTKQPNILWITTDQQRWDTINYLGNPYIRTPNLDNLCKNGTAFTKAYCQNPICQPSRASFMTGLYPSNLHVNRNGQAYFPYGRKVISKYFSENGYTCGLSGKLHLASAKGRVEQRCDDGFSYFKYCHSPMRNIGFGNEYIEWLQNKGLNLDDIFLRNESGEYYTYNPNTPAKYHQTAWCVEMGIEFLKQQQNLYPWFLCVNIFAPHPPYAPPKSCYERFDIDKLPLPIYREGEEKEQEELSKYIQHQTKIFKKPDMESKERLACYYGMIELIDDEIGKLFDYLESTNQMEDTIIIFNSDHGDMMGDHCLIKKGCRFYEGAVRVPFIIRWDGMVKKGAVIDSPVELIDIAPTIAGLTGITAAFQKHGESLVPILTGQSFEREKKFVKCEYYEPGNPYGDYSSIETFATMHFDGQYKLIVYHGYEFGELFDLKNDPCELDNLWNNDDYAAIKNRLIKDAFDTAIKVSDQGPPVRESH